MKRGAVLVRDAGAVPGNSPWDEAKHRRNPGGMGRQSGEFATMGNANHPNSISRGLGHSITTGVSPGGLDAIALHNKVKSIKGGALHVKAAQALKVAPEGVPIEAHHNMPVNTGSVPDDLDKATTLEEWRAKAKAIEYEPPSYITVSSPDVQIEHYKYWVGSGHAEYMKRQDTKKKQEADALKQAAANIKDPVQFYKWAKAQNSESFVYGAPYVVEEVGERHGEAGLEALIANGPDKESRQVATIQLQAMRQNRAVDRMLQSPVIRDYDIEKWMPIIEALSAAANNPPSNAHYRSAVYYTSSSGYKNLNQPLRRGDELSKARQAHIRHLREWIDASPLSQNVTVFRGVNADMADELFNAHVGDEFLDKGFMSTSVDPQFAAGWATSHDIGALMRIDMTAGQRAAPMFTVSAAPEENEVLVQAGSRLRIKSIDRDNRILHMELVQHEDEIGRHAKSASRSKKRSSSEEFT